MKAINHPCSLEQAEQLKALGVAQHSAFTWRVGSLGTFPIYRAMTNPDYHPDEYAAFTTDELLIMLPHFLTIKKVKAGNIIQKTKFDLYVCYDEENKEKYGISSFPSPAMAMADMLLFLINGQQLTIDEINSRLKEAAEL